jgi:hypothetical protein
MYLANRGNDTLKQVYPPFIHFTLPVIKKETFALIFLPLSSDLLRTGNIGLKDFNLQAAFVSEEISILHLGLWIK